MGPTHQFACKTVISILWFIFCHVRYGLGAVNDASGDWFLGGILVFTIKKRGPWWCLGPHTHIKPFPAAFSRIAVEERKSLKMRLSRIMGNRYRTSNRTKKKHGKKSCFHPDKCHLSMTVCIRRERWILTRQEKDFPDWANIYWNGPGSLAFETASEALTGISVLIRHLKVFSNIPSLPCHFPFSLDMQLVWTEIHWKCEKYTWFQRLCGKKEKECKISQECFTDHVELIIFQIYWVK